MKAIVWIIAAVVISASTVHADPFESLLSDIKSRSRKELTENHEREKRFFSVRQDRESLLTEARTEVADLSRQSEHLKDMIDRREQEITGLKDKLQRNMGDLGELFGVIRQISGELSADLAQSMISIHYPDRSGFLQRLSERKALPDMATLEGMWLIMLEELNESRRISRFRTPVVKADGTTRDQEVVRIGSYGAVSEGRFLFYSPEDRNLVAVSRKPPRRYQATASAFDSPTGDFVKVMIDPTRGQLLQMLTCKPTVVERIQQGGIIGYIILFMGCAGLLVGLVRYGYLHLMLQRVNRQAIDLRHATSDNPLGRIAMVYNEIRDRSHIQKEILLEEAIAREIPRVAGYNNLIKLLAAVSPLLGLLGTVTGMIITFQSITLFGTSDPKLMAGGISTALVTTVLGLCAAIPLLFVYTFIASKTKTIIDVIESQSIGLIAKDCG
ncbi:MAG: MotA/TolQ/ExbB proton channel family protein [Pseudomonadota bacterium]